MKKLKEIKKFKNEDEEFEFWSNHDLSDYIDISKGKRVLFPKLKPSTTAILIRFPEILLSELKAIANKKDIPYQSLIKVFLADKVKEELGAKGYTTRKHE